MAEFIEKTDTLNQGRVKLNSAIKDAEEAKNISVEADEKATQALANSESTQTQLDTIVIEGDSSVEAAQARVDINGNVYSTLKERLDTEYQEVTSQLVQTANGIKPNHSVWAEFEQRSFNVKWFGAKGDGTTDDTQAFQNCADMIESNGGGVLFIPFSYQGYVIKGTVQMPSNVIIEGNGTLISASSSDNSDTPFKWVDKKNILVRNLLIDGKKELKDELQSVTGGSNALTFEGNCSNIKIDNCYLYNTLEHGVHFIGIIGSEKVASSCNVEIVGCTFEDNGNPYWTAGPRGAGVMMIHGQENIKIHNNTFKNFVRVGIYADSAFGTNLESEYPWLSIAGGDLTGKSIYISDNDFIVDVDYWTDITSGDSGTGIAVHGQQNLSIVNNKIKLLAGKYRGISIDDSQESSPTDNILVSNNYIESNFNCIQLNDASFITIEGNHLKNLAGTHDTIRIEYKTRNVQEVRITNNHIRNKDYAGIYIFNETGTINNIVGIFIQDNRIINTSNTINRSAGIWTSRAMDDVVIQNNIIKRGYFGIIVGGDARNTFVHNNKISHTNTGINSTAPLVVAFNTIHDSVTGIVATNTDARQYNNIVNGSMS